jgi:hypothetical protein
VQSAPGAPSKLFYFNETVQQTASNFFVASAQDNANGAQKSRERFEALARGAGLILNWRN